MDGKEDGAGNCLPVPLGKEDKGEGEDEITRQHVQKEVAEHKALRVQGPKDRTIDEIGKVPYDQRFFPRVIVQDNIPDIFYGQAIKGVNARENDSAIVIVDKLMVAEIEVGEGGKDEDEEKGQQPGRDVVGADEGFFQ